LLQKHQTYVKEQTKSSEEKPVFLVFHGGSGSSVDDFREGRLFLAPHIHTPLTVLLAISYGVVKVNLGK
jgi:fructose-bisphosphate aldolase class II